MQKQTLLLLKCGPHTPIISSIKIALSKTVRMRHTRASRLTSCQTSDTPLRPKGTMPFAFQNYWSLVLNKLPNLPGKCYHFGGKERGSCRLCPLIRLITPLPSTKPLTDAPSHGGSRRFESCSAHQMSLAALLSNHPPVTVPIAGAVNCARLHLKARSRLHSNPVPLRNVCSITHSATAHRCTLRFVVPRLHVCRLKRTFAP